MMIFLSSFVILFPRLQLLLLLLLWCSYNHNCNFVNAFVIHTGRSGTAGTSSSNAYPHHCQEGAYRSRHIVRLHSKNNNENEQKETRLMTDTASKGLVSALTEIVNAVTAAVTKKEKTSMKSTNNRNTNNHRNSSSISSSVASSLVPPQSPEELLRRIRDDYVVENYLWTGKIDYACFEPTCIFQDPTLTFEGLDTFRTNTQNLVPIINKLVDVPNSQSQLLDIQLSSTTTTTTGGSNSNGNNNSNNNNGNTTHYVETRWNMKGNITGLFWKPKIDVIGRTKFWYREQPKTLVSSSSSASVSASSLASSSLQVYYYDEEWEIPAYQALLQIITPGVELL